MPISTRATQVLDSLHIPYRLFEHQQQPGSLEQAASERGQVVDQVIRSILFRSGKEEFFLVLIAGSKQISWRKLRAHLGVSRLSLASEEQVLRVTGCVVGTVSPIGLPQPIALLTDTGVFEAEEISIGSGARRVAIILKSVDLRLALGKFDFGQFC
jgi:Cys-tRNA(Pro)/Cys-tRNA(Cys) deacylase